MRRLRLLAISRDGSRHLAVNLTPVCPIRYRRIRRFDLQCCMVPALDQTRTVGLVTLPGAFVGALLGGAAVQSAARFQLAVLVGLLCAESITATFVAYQLGAPSVFPQPDA
jgi:putative ABC transport system permease protein